MQRSRLGDWTPVQPPPKHYVPTSSLIDKPTLAAAAKRIQARDPPLRDQVPEDASWTERRGLVMQTLARLELLQSTSGAQGSRQAQSAQVPQVSQPLRAPSDELLDPTSSKTMAVALVDALWQCGVQVDFCQSGQAAADYSGSTEAANATGYADIGSLHLLSSSFVECCEFQVYVPDDNPGGFTYEELVSDAAALQAYKDRFEQDVAHALRIERDQVRVTDIAKGSVPTKFRLSFTNAGEAAQKAEELRAQMADSTSAFYQGAVTCCVAPGLYDYSFVPVFAKLQLPVDLFETGDIGAGLFDYRNHNLGSFDTRGGEPYYFPVGWIRHPLKVKGKFDGGDDTWLAMGDEDGVWPVAYHGTSIENAESILKDNTGPHIKPGTADFYDQEAEAQGAPAGSKSIYVTPDVAINELDGQATLVRLPIVEENGTAGFAEYRVAFMCRINRRFRTKHNFWQEGYEDRSSLPAGDPAYWRMWQEDAVRPYGLLIKKVPPNSSD